MPKIMKMTKMMGSAQMRKHQRQPMLGSATRHGAADDIAEVPHGGGDAAHEAALIGGHEFTDEDGGDVVAAAEATPVIKRSRPKME